MGKMVKRLIDIKNKNAPKRSFCVGNFDKMKNIITLVVIKNVKNKKSRNTK